jgi:hypothetical protein
MRQPVRRGVADDKTALERTFLFELGRRPDRLRAPTFRRGTFGGCNSLRTSNECRRICTPNPEKLSYFEQAELNFERAEIN